MSDLLTSVFADHGLITAFALIGLLMIASNAIGTHLFAGRIHGSAIAIMVGLVLAYVGGVVTGGEDGIADLALFTGVGLMGGSMLRDFAIVATAFEVNVAEVRRSGLIGITALGLGVVLPFIAGAACAVAFGYRDPVSISTIAAGALTYIVGPVTGTALGADSTVIALSVAIGVMKSVSVMVITPFVARPVGLSTPASAMAFGGLMGTTSGVAAGLAATDPRLVPYGAMTATFHTGLGCLLGPSVLFLATRAIFG